MSTDPTRRHEAAPEPSPEPSLETAPEPRPPAEKGTAHVLVQLRWPLTILALALLALLGYGWTVMQAKSGAAAARDAVGEVAKGAERIARNFMTGNVTERFLSAIPEIDGSGIGRLEVATLKATESLERSDERRVMWDLLSLGTTTAEIEVPVTYRYHIDLADVWRIEVDGQICRVYAPDIKPTLPPAIHTHHMRTRIEQDLLRTDAEEQLAELQRQLTPRLTMMARQPQRIDLVRETARRSIADFVRTWLLSEEQWGDDRLVAIQVAFPDEVEAQRQPPGVTLELGDHIEQTPIVLDTGTGQ